MPLGAIAFDYLALLLSSVMSFRMEQDAIVAMTATMVETPSPLLATAAKAGGAMTLAELGMKNEARELLSQIPRAGLNYRDQYELAWLPGATLLSQAAVALGDAARAAESVDQLEPYREEWVVWGSGFMCFGPVAMRRGHAALVAGQLDVAREDLALARREIVQSGGRIFEPHVDVAEAELAIEEDRPLDAIALYTQAAATCTELDLETAAGMFAARAIELAQAGSDATPRDRGFRRQGAVWTVQFDGQSAAVPHTKGMAALEALLANPRRQFHALELAAVIDHTTGDGADSPAIRRDSGDDLLDPRAMSEYRRRLEELQADIDEADRFSDDERRARAQREMDSILEEFGRATGLGGKSLKTTTNAERARVRVTKLIRSTISRIDGIDPKAGYHLSATVKTGAFCSYEPERADPTWQVG